jgi:hypothetical protein
LSTKNKSNLYLYLALVCFVGILVIFVVDGYLGVYDTIYMTVQEHEQVIEPDYWQQPWVKGGNEGYSVGVSWGESIPFRYEIDNRSFSTYSANVEVSIWKSGQQIILLLDKKEVSIKPFKKMTVDWALQSDDLERSNYGTGEYTVRIVRGETERRIIMSYYPQVPGNPVKLPPPPVAAPESSR